MRLLSCLILTVAANCAPFGPPVVEVFLPDVFGGETIVAFYQARGVVDEIYSEIGVRVVWSSMRSAPAGCTKQPLRRRIVVELQSAASAGHSAAAMAFSNPYAANGPCVTLLMDRMQPAIKLNPVRTGILLGHILAHEMGHVLQGIGRHSQTGLMKAQWSVQDTSLMYFHKRLQFTVSDVELIFDAFGSPSPNIRPAGNQSPATPVLAIRQRPDR